MPVVAVAGMIGGASALAAGGLTVLQTIAAIGGIVGGIGAITGNKTLVQIGAVAGLAGGLGAWAQGKGFLADPTASGTAAGAADQSAITAMKNAPSGAEVTGAMDAATGAVSSPVSGGPLPAGQELGQLDMRPPPTTNTITDTISQSSPEATKVMGGAQEPVSGLAGAGAEPNGLAGATLSKAELDGTNAFGANSVPGAYDLAQSPGAQGKGILDTLKDFGAFFNENKELASFGFNFLGGAFDEKKKAEAEWASAMADEKRQQMANANAVPSMGFGSTPKPGGTFRQTQPTYRPVRVGGLYSAR